MRAVTRLIDKGFEAYLVGGCVRDLLLDRTPKDYDIATEARPPQVKRTFPRNCRIIGRRFKLAHLHFHGNTKILECSTFRRTPQEKPEGEGEDADLLITRDNEFGTAEEDALRRDFTVNALFLDPTRDLIVDHCHGLEDIEARVIRTIGDPVVRFREDPVRILRAAKFAGRLGFTVEKHTLAAMGETAEDLKRAAPPRVLEEILRLLRSGHAKSSFELLRDVGAIEHLIPVVGSFLEKATDEQVDSFWNLLDALDRRVQSQPANSEPPPNGVLLAVMMYGAVAAERENEPSRSASSIAEKLLGSLAVDLRLPRRDSGCLKRICGVQHRFEQAEDKRRFRVEAFVHSPYFEEALQLYALRTVAAGNERTNVDHWYDLAGTHPIEDDEQSENAAPETEEAAPRKKRRRRRRRRSDEDEAEASSTTDDATAQTEQPEAESTDGAQGSDTEHAEDSPSPEEAVTAPEDHSEEPAEPADEKPAAKKKATRKKAAKKTAAKKRPARKKPRTDDEDLSDVMFPSDEPEQPSEPEESSQSAAEVAEEPKPVKRRRAHSKFPKDRRNDGDVDRDSRNESRGETHDDVHEDAHDDVRDDARDDAHEDAAAEQDDRAGDRRDGDHDDEPRRPRAKRSRRGRGRRGARDDDERDDRRDTDQRDSGDHDTDHRDGDRHEQAHHDEDADRDHEERDDNRVPRDEDRDRDDGPPRKRRRRGRRGRGRSDEDRGDDREERAAAGRDERTTDDGDGDDRERDASDGDDREGARPRRSRSRLKGKKANDGRDKKSGEGRDKKRDGQKRDGQKDGKRGSKRDGKRDGKRGKRSSRPSGGRDVDVVPRYRDRRGKVEVIEPPSLDLSAFDVELDPKRVPTFGSIVEGKGRPKKRSPRIMDGDGDGYRPPPPPGGGGDSKRPDTPPPAPPADGPDTFGDW